MTENPSSETLARRLVYLAAERTLMSWIRAALGMMALGFVIDRFGLVLRQVMPNVGPKVYPPALSFWAGVVMVVLGALMALVATVRYFRFEIAYEREQTTNPREGILVGVIFSALVSVIGLGIAALLIFMPR